MKKILIIEDNAEVRENLEEILELYGYAVETAEDGTVGVRLALQNPPDLILCDVMMPQLDGFGVLNILSKKPATADVPFIFLTAKSEQADFRRGMNLGADDYLTKPFFKDDLLSVIEKRLKKSERLQQKFENNSAGWSAFINEAKGLESLNKLSDDHPAKSFKNKHLLFEEGDLPRYLYLVQSGQVKLYKTTDYGKELIIRIAKAGDFIGYTSLIKGETFQFAASVMNGAEINLIPKEDFQQLLYSDKDVAARFIKMLADNVIDKEEQLLHLAYDSVRKRVAEAILTLNQKDAEPIAILRDDLARIVGTAKESVIRMLSEFKNDGYIDVVDGGKILILEEERLREIQ